MAQNFSISAGSDVVLRSGSAGIRKGFALAAAAAAMVLALALAAPSQAQEKEKAANGDTIYKVTDEPGSPPVNYRSEQDPQYDTKKQHDAEMYAEQYEKERRRKQQEEKEQLQRILNFSGGGTDPNGVNPTGDSMGRY